MRTLPLITIETVLDRGPCWPDAERKLRALNERFKREKWTALEVLSLDGVSADDRLWVCLHESALPSAVLRRFAVEAAAHAMRLTGWTDARSWAALDAAMAYERGQIRAAASDASSAAAWDAARAAARAAASNAAWAAAWDAARAASRDAASDASRDAAWAAAWDAASDASSDASRAAAWAAQICMLRQITLLWCDGYDILAGGPWERKARAA